MLRSLLSVFSLFLVSFSIKPYPELKDMIVAEYVTFPNLIPIATLNLKSSGIPNPIQIPKPNEMIRLRFLIVVALPIKIMVCSCAIFSDPITSMDNNNFVALLATTHNLHMFPLTGNTLYPDAKRYDYYKFLFRPVA